MIPSPAAPERQQQQREEVVIEEEIGSNNNNSAASSSQQRKRNNNSSRRSMMGVDDTAKLRRVLRAVHCLQQERGASCAFCVRLRGCPGRDMALLRQARAGTDRALSSLVRRDYNDVDGGSGNLLEVTLGKIRKLIDYQQQRSMAEAAEDDDGAVINGCDGDIHPNHYHHHPQAPPSARRLLVSFSTLISAVLHENIIRPGGGSGSSPSSSSSSSFPRVRSSGDLARGGVMATTDEAIAAKNRRRRLRRRNNKSDMDPVLSHLPEIHPKQLPRLESGGSLTSSSDMTPDNQDQFIHSCHDHDHELQCEHQPKPSVEQNRYRQMNLLGLLDIFVRLKESNGVERASLTSILMSSNEEEASRLLSDVALEVENQRRLLEELAIVPPGSLRNLVTELVTMSPEMSQLQTQVLGGLLSLDGLRGQYDSDKLWDIMTVYIDKLHSLELLIVEEIELCSPPPSSILSRPGSASAEDLSKLIGDAFLGGGARDNNQEGSSSLTTAEELLHSIQSMSPAEVKKRMLSVLRKEQSSSPGKEKYSKKGVDELLQELCNAPTAKEWEIDIYELRFLKRIGQGSAGTTYAADWAGLKVAVKVASITEMGLEGWRTEVQALQKLHHPNIIRLLGSVYHANPLTFCLVLEHCDGGDLASAALCKVTPRDFFFHVSTSIAKGLSYLHNRFIIHRDVKPSNVLIQGELSSGNYQVKVTDFGVATDLHNVRDRTAETGTYRWMAPEVIRHEKYTQTADVYSYAVLIWQLITREEPFADRGQIEAAVAVSMHSARPPLPTDTPIAIRELIERCWSEDPEERPPFDEIDDTIADIFKNNLTEDEKRWLDSPLGHNVYMKAQEEKEAKELKLPVLDGSPAGKKTPEVNNRNNGHRNYQNDNNDAKKRNRLRTMFQRKSSFF